MPRLAHKVSDLGNFADVAVVTVVAADATGDQCTSSFSVADDESPCELTMPTTAGTYDLRDVMSAADVGKGAIARRSISLR